MRKKLITFLMCCCFIVGNTAYANTMSMTASSQATSMNDTNVRVVKHIGNEQIVVYTGPISQYENGLCTSVDFVNNSFAVFFVWDELDAVYYIYPIESDTQDSQLTSTSQVQSVGGNANQSNILFNGIISNEDGISFTSQIKINCVNTGEDGLRIIDDASLDCSFNVTNSTNSGKDITLLLATYDENMRIVNVKKSDVAVPAGISGNIRIVYQFNADAEKSAKLMLWHSGIMPVRASVNFDGESGANAYYYDANNRLVQIDKRNGVSIYYTYDNMGNLITKAVRGGEYNV